MKRTENKVYLRLHDFLCEPDEITRQLSLSPTNFWQKGDIIPDRKSVIRRKQSTWELKSALEESESVENHIDYLLKGIEANSEIFKKLTKEHLGELAVVIYTYNDFNIGINLRNETINKISELGLMIDFDIYFLKNQI